MGRIQRWERALPADILPYCLLFRVVVIGGRFGGGKTALAVWLSYRLAAEGEIDRICSNIPLSVPGFSLAERLPERPPTWPRRAAIVYDEAWLDLGRGASARTVREYLAYLRKLDCVLFAPSVHPLTSALGGIAVRRAWNGLVLGIPLWVYAWQLPAEAAPHYYWWPRPQRVWGWYDTEYRPGDEWFIYTRRALIPAPAPPPALPAPAAEAAQAEVVQAEAEVVRAEPAPVRRRRRDWENSVSIARIVAIIAMIAAIILAARAILFTPAL